MAILIEPFAQAFYEHTLEIEEQGSCLVDPPAWIELDAKSKELYRIRASKFIRRYTELALAPKPYDPTLSTISTIDTLETIGSLLDQAAKKRGIEK